MKVVVELNLKTKKDRDIFALVSGGKFSISEGDKKDISGLVDSKDAVAEEPAKTEPVKEEPAKESEEDVKQGEALAKVSADFKAYSAKNGKVALRELNTKVFAKIGKEVARVTTLTLEELTLYKTTFDSMANGTPEAEDDVDSLI